MSGAGLQAWLYPGFVSDLWKGCVHHGSVGVLRPPHCSPGVCVLPMLHQVWGPPACAPG
uniref:RIKEN cDNA 1700018B08 gene n=1 Tax=Mus musculus TaxID=10090 RepID=S4R1L4_MOUSE